MLMLEVKAGIALLKMLSQTHVWKVRVQGERRRGEGEEGEDKDHRDPRDCEKSRKRQ
jgi:hypothetical protein